MEQDIFDEVNTYADDIADWQITRFEREAQKNTEAYPEYAQAVSQMEDEGSALIQKLGGDEMAIEGLLCACLARGAALAVVMYKRGVLDGGRLFHAFLTRELPRKEDAE